MPKQTLLQMTQSILSDMSSDEVNSISDTIEAAQVAQIIKDTYFNLIDGRDWPHLYQLFQLTASGDNTKPTHMTLPEDVIDINWVKYNTKEEVSDAERFQDIAYKTPQEFMKILDARKSDASNTLVVTDDSGVQLNIQDDKAPQYYTSFDNDNLIFDSYDAALDSTLAENKTQCYGKLYPSWTHSDNAIPDLPAQAFSLLLNESKATCALKLLQAQDVKAEQHSLTQRRRMSQEAWRVTNGITYGNYGRKSVKNGS